MTEPQVTPRQCVEAIQEIAQGWSADDSRWAALGVLMDYSIQFGQRDYENRDRYYCPTSGDVESASHGGFDVCCDRPDLHQAVGTIG